MNVSIDTRTRVEAEASVWVARFKGDDRTPATDAAFQKWVDETPGGQDAFDRLTAVWEALPGAFDVYLDAEDTKVHVLKPRGHRKVYVGMALAAALVVGFVFGGNWALSRPEILATGTGQSRAVTLSDGSVVTLNTKTRVEVRIHGRKRDLRLVEGEARFDVAHDPARPFVVATEVGQVRALGTSFIVRDSEGPTSVLLLKGRVEVSSGPAAVILSSGQRALFTEDNKLTVDQPDLWAATAWQSGKVVFSNTTLIQAIGEMNRYAEKPVQVRDLALGNARVSGVYDTRDVPEFARGVAQVNGLKVRETATAIEVSR